MVGKFGGLLSWRRQYGIKVGGDGIVKMVGCDRKGRE